VKFDKALLLIGSTTTALSTGDESCAQSVGAASERGVARAMRRAVTLVTVFATGLGLASAATAASGEAAPPTYASVRVEVSVKQGPPPAKDRRRPENFFQLAGAADAKLCGDVLKAFNEPGRYSGEDGTRWLLDNSHQIDFSSIDPQAKPGTQYVFPDLEHASVDVDADGKAEHVYRLNSVVHSMWIQRLMIVPDELQRHPELLASHVERCKEMEPRADCESASTSIRYAVMAGVPERLKNEWMFSKQGALNQVTRDQASRQLIYVSRNQARRNVAMESNAYLSLYSLPTAVVVVAAPIFEFAPPELLVFTPHEHRIGVLQCVVMPVAWHK
jgi:hypothetical protein